LEAEPSQWFRVPGQHWLPRQKLVFFSREKETSKLVCVSYFGEKPLVYGLSCLSCPDPKASRQSAVN
jgi:hypothetical protein